MGRKKKEDTMEETTETTETETTETEVATDTRSKREIILEAIEEGGATIESLMEAADCKYASVMSNFTMLRLMGKCPVKDVDTEVPVLDKDGYETFDDNGDAITATIQTLRLVSSEEWEAIKAEKAANAKAGKSPARTPEEVVALIEKRVEKAEKALAVAKTRSEADEASEILTLREQGADIALQIANLELAEAQEKVVAE